MQCKDQIASLEYLLSLQSIIITRRFVSVYVGCLAWKPHSPLKRYNCWVSSDVAAQKAKDSILSLRSEPTEKTHLYAAMTTPDDNEVISNPATLPKYSKSRQSAASFISLDIDIGDIQVGEGGEGRNNTPTLSSKTSDTLSHIVEEDMTLWGILRFKIRRVVEHISVQILSIVLIIVDVSLTISSIASTDEDYDKTVRMVSNVFLGYFVLEICLRFLAIGPHRFVRTVWEVADAVVILISLIITVTVTDPEGREFGQLSILGRIFRLVRLIRLIPQCRRCILSVRLTTSENKRRYREEGYDLDLTYITERVIAMSFPSSGWLALYRNPIEEVAKFFKSKYKGHYRIYNLCSERDYDYEPFDFSVQRYMIDDHNVPTLHQMYDFVRDAQRFLKKSDKNVIAVHCKGGKGRTGSMICAYLMYSAKAQFSTGEGTREYFATRRSDLRVSSKFQGVQTPSQCRFIDYWQEIIQTYDCVIPEAPSIFIKRLIVHSPPHPIQSPSCNMLVEVCDRSQPLSSFNLMSCSSLCKVSNNDGDLVIEFHDQAKPCVTGDTKIRFKSPNLPIKYDKASFYFWFNTTFVKGGEVRIEREMLDNPHFVKYNKVYDENFAVTVVFDSKQQQRLV